MKIGNVWLVAAASLALAACTTATTGISTEDAPEFITELPESVVSKAAPGQNLSAVIIRQEDQCYWYQWVGPVETTFLPLRTTDGRLICARAS